MRRLAAMVVEATLLPAPARALPIFGPDELILGAAEWLRRYLWYGPPRAISAAR